MFFGFGDVGKAWPALGPWMPPNLINLNRECSRCGRFSAPFPGGPGGRVEDLSKVRFGNLEKSVWASGWGVS